MLCCVVLCFVLYCGLFVVYLFKQLLAVPSHTKKTATELCRSLGVPYATVQYKTQPRSALGQAS